MQAPIPSSHRTLAPPSCSMPDAQVRNSLCTRLLLNASVMLRAEQFKCLHQHSCPLSSSTPSAWHRIVLHICLTVDVARSRLVSCISDHTSILCHQSCLHLTSDVCRVLLQGHSAHCIPLIKSACLCRGRFHQQLEHHACKTHRECGWGSIPPCDGQTWCNLQKRRGAAAHHLPSSCRRLQRLQRVLC